MLYDRLLQPLHRSPFRSTLLQTCHKQFNETAVSQLSEQHHTFTLLYILVLAYTIIHWFTLNTCTCRPIHNGTVFKTRRAVCITVYDHFVVR